jgi:hypothetical protein
VNVFDAARCLGISVDTVRRRINAGELKARKARQGQNFTWWVDLPDDLASPRPERSRPTQEETTPAQGHQGDGRANVDAAHAQALLESQAALISTLQTQVQAQQGELAAKNQQISELHVLMQQLQAALPAPGAARPWWKWWGRN